MFFLCGVEWRGRTKSKKKRGRKEGRKKGGLDGWNVGFFLSGTKKIIIKIAVSIKIIVLHTNLGVSHFTRILRRSEE